MKRFLAIVEGPHDANFLGVELRRRGFQKVKLVEEVDDFWLTLIPKVFPNGRQLEHVVQYPDIYRKIDNTDQTCAILVAGSDSKLVSELRVTLEAVDPTLIDAICIIADADQHHAQRRHSQLCRALEALNKSHGPGGTDGSKNGIPGFPLPIPQFRNVTSGRPTLGIYVLPDDNGPGTLDLLLLECAKTSFASICESAQNFVNDAHNAVATDSRFDQLRKPSGRKKAAAGVIGNILFPGTALSVAIDRGNWHEPSSGDEKGLNAFRKFCDDFFQ